MKFRIAILPGIIFILWMNASAQKLELHNVKVITNDKFKSSSEYFFTSHLPERKMQPSLVMLNKQGKVYEIASVPQGFFYDAFFCKLETRVRKSTNIWIKMRVGNFEDYEK